MGTYYDKLHFWLKRRFDRLSPRAHGRMVVGLLSVYGLLTCFFIVKFTVERKHRRPPTELLIDSPIRTDTVLIIKPIKKIDNDTGKG
ncbi:MAG TPA: hypothetical protein PKC47_00510 [Petrimonas sp.]|nr:hypothetical protein [Petrimonas sp.]